MHSNISLYCVSLNSRHQESFTTCVPRENIHYAVTYSGLRGTNISRNAVTILRCNKSYSWFTADRNRLPS